MTVVFNHPFFEFVQAIKESRKLLDNRLRFLVYAALKHTCNKDFLVHVKPAAYFQQIPHYVTFPLIVLRD